ncbi:FACT complex subunit Spt16, N-terminal lobe domain-containing protein, partial [Dimargaris cristalligena]
MADSVQFDAKAFHKRANAILRHWKDTKAAGDPDELYHQADVILVPVGVAGEDANPYRKSTALQSWLTGYELPNTLTLITPTKFYFVASSNKGKMLEALNQPSADVTSRVPLQVFRRGKDATENAQIFATIIETIKTTGEGKRIGGFPKDVSGGKFMDEWEAAFNP